MKVQRVRPPNTDQARWIVLDDEFVPIQPICSYLTFLDDLDRSPNTIRSTAHHLKLFWEYLRDAHMRRGAVAELPFPVGYEDRPGAWSQTCRPLCRRWFSPDCSSR